MDCSSILPVSSIYPPFGQRWFLGDDRILFLIEENWTQIGVDFYTCAHKLFTKNWGEKSHREYKNKKSVIVVFICGLSAIRVDLRPIKSVR